MCYLDAVLVVKNQSEHYSLSVCYWRAEREGNCTPPEGWKEGRGEGEKASQSHGKRRKKKKDHRPILERCTVRLLSFLCLLRTVCSAVCGSAESPMLTAVVIHWGSLSGPND